MFLVELGLVKSGWKKGRIEWKAAQVALVLVFFAKSNYALQEERREPEKATLEHFLGLAREAHLPI